MRGHTITRQTGQIIAADLRTRRFDYQPQRVAKSQRSQPESTSGGITYRIVSLRTASSSVPAEAPYTGLVIATVEVKGVSPGLEYLIGTEVDVVDHSADVFDLTEAELFNVYGWASERVYASLAPGAPSGTLTPIHWAADDRVCV